MARVDPGDIPFKKSFESVVKILQGIAVQILRKNTHVGSLVQKYVIPRKE